MMDVTAAAFPTAYPTAASSGDARNGALSGLADARNKLDEAAKALATGPATPEVVLDVSQAQLQFAASAEVLNTAQDNTKRLLDILS